MDLMLAIVITLPILIYSAILHEIAHGLVAERLGDPTARLMGRITLNPIPHIDPVMSILLPVLLISQSIYTSIHIIIGGAKPVPVDPFNFREPKKDMALVSLAGPVTNLLIAIIFGVVCRIIFPNSNLTQILNLSILGTFLGTIVYINLILAVFNLIPIPPLDGSKVIAQFLPDKEAAAYLSIGTFGIFIIFFLLLFPIGGFSLGGFISNLLTFSLNLLGI
jgi:Zn-dependent protease